MDTITFNIKRFDGEKTWVQSYEFPYMVETLLGCLNHIREELDITLCFTSACRHAICGSCAVQVNGSAFLACETQLDDLISIYETHEFDVEPLNNFPVVRDLVVSFDEKAEKMKRVMPWMCERSGRDSHDQSAADFSKYMHSIDCVLCGICASECRELRYDDGTYMEPFALNRAFRFVRDTRDGADDERIAAVLDNELWKCIHCQQCTSKCPKDIDIAGEISYLRRRAVASGDSGMGARHAKAFGDDLTKTGMLNEAMLAMKTEGLFKTAANRVPFAMRMVASGKMNPLHSPKPVAGIEGVRRLYEIAQSEKED